MNTLKKSSKAIIKQLKEGKELFEHFEQVYLFGSVLELNNRYNDIDILLIYREYSIEMKQWLRQIDNELQRMCYSPIDFTVLSYEEEKEVQFLERLKTNYLKIK